ncbi:MAG: efflux transporter outer membrane subunit [Coxiellaceae bacterium]|nr:efflux transporter outer membrane subunit [Coxiellaceae bacterium]
MNHKKILTYSAISLILSACTVGPDYKKPTINVPTHFKEAKNNGWKKASPADLKDRGEWWTAFHDQQLNVLEKELNSHDQNIETATAQYMQAFAMIEQARAAYFPFVAGSAAWNFQNASGGGSASNPTNPGSAAGGGGGSFQSFGLNASWEGDLWGNIRRNVEAVTATAEASKAKIAAIQLSDQASLAQYYFELRGVDNDQAFLDNIVLHNQKLLTVAYAKMKEGVFSLSNVIQARNALNVAKQTAENNKINRGLYEHAIAILLGKPPADFALPAKFYSFHPPKIPGILPSEMLERRPDVAAAERAVAAANAQIGVAKAAYFPVLSLSPWAGWTSSNFNSFSSSPLFSWSLGPQLAQYVFDGGVRESNFLAAKANYRATVSQYRQAVLVAFQNVEDSLTQLHSLNEQVVITKHAARDARTSFSLTHTEFQGGTVAAPDVDSSSIETLTADKNASDAAALQMTYTVALIKALGGAY